MDTNETLDIEKRFFDSLARATPFQLRLCLQSAGGLTTEEEKLAWHDMKTPDERERHIRAAVASLTNPDRHRVMTTWLAVQLRVATRALASPPATTASREYDAEACFLVELIADRYWLRNDYGDIGSLLGCRILRAMDGYAHYAIWRNRPGFGEVDATGSQDFGVALCDVVPELRAWLPTVDLKEVGFCENLEDQYCWLMLVQTTEAHPAWDACDVDRYREVETQIDAWLREHYDFSGAQPAAVDAAAAADAAAEKARNDGKTARFKINPFI